MVGIQDFLYLYWLDLFLDLRAHRAFLLDLGSNLPNSVVDFRSRRSFEGHRVDFRELITFQHL